jgi:hypothetical protein
MVTCIIVTLRAMVDMVRSHLAQVVSALCQSSVTQPISYAQWPMESLSLPTA